MKTAKFVIMLQVLFLVGIFVFSASAVYQPGQGGPLATTNLALKQEGLELASPEHDVYQKGLISNKHNVEKAVAALRAGQAPDNAKAIAIPGSDNPVYLVSFLDESDKTQFLVVMTDGGNAEKMIALGVEKNNSLSDEYGIFIGPCPTKSIESAISAGKASSAGVIEVLTAISSQLEEYKKSGNPHLLQDALRRLSDIGPAAEIMLPTLDILLENETDSTLMASIEMTIMAIENQSPLGEDISALLDIMDTNDLGPSAVQAIIDMGPSAIPLLQAELDTIDPNGVKADIIREVINGIEFASKVSFEAKLSDIRKQLRSENPETQIGGMHELAKLGPHYIYFVPEDIFKLAKNGEPSVQKVAVFVIARAGYGFDISEIKDTLIEFLDNKDSAIRTNAALALVNGKDQAIDALTKRVQTANKELAENIKEIIKTIESSADLYQPNQLAIELKAAEYELKTLQNELVAANNTMDNTTLANASAATVKKSIAEVAKLKQVIIAVESRVAEIKNDMATFFETASATTSSAGTIAVEEVKILNFIAKLSYSELLTDSSRKHYIMSLKGVLDDLFDRSIYNPESSVREKATNTIFKIQTSIASALDMLEKISEEKSYIEKMRKSLEDVIRTGTEIQPINMSTGLFGSRVNQEPDYESQIRDVEEELATQKRALELSEHDQDAGIKPVGDITALTRAVNASELQISALKRKIEIRDAKKGIKASSSGFEKEIQDAMVYLSGATDAFTNVGTIPKLNADMLLKQVEIYKDTIDNLDAIKNQSPDAAIAATEHINQVQASLDTMTAVQSIVAEDVLLPETTGTIVINDKDIPDNQKILLTMLDKSNPYLEALQTKLGCQVRLLSQYNAKTDGIGHTIAISSMSVGDISRRIDIKSVTQDGYLPLEQVIVLAKGLLTYSQDTKPVLDGIISQMYRFITKSPLSPELLVAFLKNSVFILDLPIPVAIDEAYYEQLHRQALAALIAA